MRKCELQFSRYLVAVVVSIVITLILAVLGYGLRSDAVMDVCILFGGVSLALGAVVIVYGHQVIKGS